LRRDCEGGGGGARADLSSVAESVVAELCSSRCLSLSKAAARVVLIGLSARAEVISLARDLIVVLRGDVCRMLAAPYRQVRICKRVLYGAFQWNRSSSFAAFRRLAVLDTVDDIHCRGFEDIHAGAVIEAGGPWCRSIGVLVTGSLHLKGVRVM